MNKKNTLITMVILLALINIPLLAQGLDDLTGTYSISYYGELTDKYRIKKAGTAYTLDEKKADKTDFIWKDLDVPLASISKEEFEKMANIKVDGPLIGLKKGQDLLIFKANKGFTIGRFTTNTGYFSLSNIGFAELTKKD